MACITRTITGYIEEWGTGNSYFTVFLLTNGDFLDKFDMATDTHEIRLELSACTHRLLGIENNTQSYLELISDLGLEIPSKWKKHWTPTLKASTLWYIIDSKGQVGVNSFSNSTFDNELVANFNIFPTKELAEQATNVSKLGRLILLWQYANDCLFVLDDDKHRHYIIYDVLESEVSCDYTKNYQMNDVPFRTNKQAKAFIDMYEAEIKELMNIK